MIMEIHSSLGVLKCIELEKQAIENSIPEGQVQEQNKDIATEETTPNNP